MTDEHQQDKKSAQRARYEFKRALESLRAHRGSGTELVSVYITPDRNLVDVNNQLRAELGQAQNIKSKSTKKNVSSALESILQRLKNYKKPPENGLVLLAGEVVVGNNKTQSVAEAIVPPDRVPINTYRCDSTFFLEPLEGMLDVQENYGLVVVDRQEATIGVLRGQHVDVTRNLQSFVPRKHRKGGQSQRRLERNIEIEADAFFKKVVDNACEIFQAETNLKGVLVGGPGATKDYVVDQENWWHYEVANKIIATFDTGYTDEYGLRELVEAAHGTLEQMGLTRESDFVKQFMAELRKDAPLAAYGEDEVREMLGMGAVETLLLADALRKWRVKAACPQGHGEQDLTTSNLETTAKTATCETCDASLDILESVDVVNELSELADDIGASVEIITGQSTEGEIFFTAFGGIAALLRFRP